MNRFFESDIKTVFADVFKIMVSIDPSLIEEDVEVYTWVQVFGSTAGPRRGVIAGHMMTPFQVYGFWDPMLGRGILYCNGVTQLWLKREFQWQQ